jgi:hypothetical protein
VFFSLAKVSTIAAVPNIKQSSSSDDESSNCVRRRDLFLDMIPERQIYPKSKPQFTITENKN